MDGDNIVTFTDTVHCAEQAHCARCRELSPKARRFRLNMIRAFGGEEIDFACPRGKTWVQEDTEHAKKMEAEEQRRLALCRASCDLVTPDGYDCAVDSGCCGGRKRSPLQRKCVKGR